MSNTSFLSNNLKNIKPSVVSVIGAKVKELRSKDHDVIDLGIGEPDFDTPNNAKEAAIAAITDNHTHYPPIPGLDILKHAIIEKFKRENNLLYNKEHIIAGTGAKQIIFNALYSTINKDDEVLIPTPYWVSYPEMVKVVGGVPVFVKCEDDFSISIDDLKAKITNKTKWILLNSPNNPSGYCFSQENIEQIGALLKDHPNILILSDDIYEHLIYDDHIFFNIANICPELLDRILIVNGVSKAYAMTGWRIGYGASKNITLIKAMTSLQSHSTSGACSIAQHAAAEALGGPQSSVAIMRMSFCDRRNYVMDLIKKDVTRISFQCPHGAFYLFLNISDAIGKIGKNDFHITNSVSFAEYLLDNFYLAVVPGEAFGLDKYIRISFATNKEILKEAISRLKEAFLTIK
ncbi:MAG: pyridoxal phosphate-dependent aminotransferase [Anaplasmataceae bacterium]|nr:pyridoxal phosphate-dependent aminotransferase [Anaplasmataceae bacterium]